MASTVRSIAASLHFPEPSNIIAAAIKMPGRTMARPTRKTRHYLPAVWMRAGTSKGLFIHRSDLPAREEAWGPILLSAMGSQDSDSMQLNGIGGATSTTSKVAIVAPSKRPGVDVDYTFAQVAVGASAVDMSGNCGNIASGVGPFAIDEGLVDVRPGQTEVRPRRNLGVMVCG